MSRWILVAEDERQLGEMLCDNLSLESYHAEHVLTGPDALERMEQGGVDLLILDVMMPGKDGFEVLQELRARGDATPVLILSARSDDQDRIRGLTVRLREGEPKQRNVRFHSASHPSVEESAQGDKKGQCGFRGAPPPGVPPDALRPSRRNRVRVRFRLRVRVRVRATDS